MPIRAKRAQLVLTFSPTAMNAKPIPLPALRLRQICLWVALLAISVPGTAAERSIRVFIALCDNKTQGIIPVGAKIGDGDNPEANLYWGCSEGFGETFKESSKWRVTESASDVSPSILRRMTLRHVGAEITLTTDAYRGSAMRQCLQDFETAAASNQFDLVAYIGHNGLMDFTLPELAPVVGNDTEVMVLCCVSDRYFSERLKRLGCKPILMTTQLMYPGAFLLHDGIESWRNGGSLADIRGAAGRAYAKNQGISVRSGTGVFAELSAANAGDE